MFLKKTSSKYSIPNFFIYFAELILRGAVCRLQDARRGLPGAGRGMWVNWRSITQQNMKKTFLCQ